MRRAFIRNKVRAWRRWWSPRDAARPETGESRLHARNVTLIRLRHVAIACGVSLLLGGATLLEPIDQTTWAAQSRLVQKQPSGEIAFVALSPDIAASSSAHARRNLARMLDRLREAGPKLVVLDVVFEEPSEPSADAMLREALARYGDRIVLVQRAVENLDGELQYKGSTAEVSGSAPTFPTHRYVNYLGLTWNYEAFVKIDLMSKMTAPVVLAEDHASSEREFGIDYRYNTSKLASVSYSSISDKGKFSRLAGKKVVIGTDLGSITDTARLPGRSIVPASYIIILAAETLIGGVPWFIPLFLPVTIIALMLGSAALLRNPKLRSGLYLTTTAICLSSTYLTALYNLRVTYGTVLAALVIYAALRIWWRAKNRGILFDDRTGLRTFRALEKEFTPQETQTSSVIVARIHNFDDVLSVLPEARHSGYLKLLSDRLRITDEDRQLYSGGSGYFAWTMPAMGRERLSDHLLGTRLLCYEPVQLGEVAIDINVTFGVDASADNSPARKLASARNAASRSNEADQPIVFVEHTADEEQVWNLSIQHKIDAAIENGQIYPVFQPQFCTASGKIVGIEALVRWKDPVRGVVPTDWFIDQCEKAGRMDRLTRLMLRESMRQIGELAPNGSLRLSVNISAISLQDMRLYEVVRDVLHTTGFNPARLTLELTETWHIAKPELAASIMERIGELGVRWALDDFGVRTATYDALMMYPIDEIKIDRSLTGKVLDLRRGRRIVRSICRMGAEMEVEVVAEGVETEAEFETLRGFGCPIVQGFVLAPPLPINELRGLLSFHGTAGGRAS